MGIRSTVPGGEFDSLDPDPETVRELGYRAVDMMADHFAEIRAVDTLPDVAPPGVATEFADPLPRVGADPETVLAEWEDRVYQYAAHQGSPR